MHQVLFLCRLRCKGGCKTIFGIGLASGGVGTRPLRPHAALLHNATLLTVPGQSLTGSLCARSPLARPPGINSRRYAKWPPLGTSNGYGCAPRPLRVLRSPFALASRVVVAPWPKSVHQAVARFTGTMMRASGWALASVSMCAVSSSSRRAAGAPAGPAPRTRSGRPGWPASNARQPRSGWHCPAFSVRVRLGGFPRPAKRKPGAAAGFETPLRVPTPGRKGQGAISSCTVYSLRLAR